MSDNQYIVPRIPAKIFCKNVQHKSKYLLELPDLNCSYLNKLAELNRLFVEVERANEKRYTEIVAEIKEINNFNQHIQPVISEFINLFYIIRPSNVWPKYWKLETDLGIPRSKINIKNEFYGLVDTPLWCIEKWTHKNKFVRAISEDDLETFKELCCADPTFDFDFFISLRPFEHCQLGYLDIAAWYGAVKCFKYLLVNNAKSNKFIFDTAIAGGNYEIIRILEINKDKIGYCDLKPVFAITSIIYHRPEIYDWLVLNNDMITIDDQITGLVVSRNFLYLKLWFLNGNNLLSIVCDIIEENYTNYGFKHLIRHYREYIE